MPRKECKFIIKHQQSYFYEVTITKASPWLIFCLYIPCFAFTMDRFVCTRKSELICNNIHAFFFHQIRESTRNVLHRNIRAISVMEQTEKDMRVKEMNVCFDWKMVCWILHRMKYARHRYIINLRTKALFGVLAVATAFVLLFLPMRPCCMPSNDDGYQLDGGKEWFIQEIIFVIGKSL